MSYSATDNQNEIQILDFLTRLRPALSLILPYKFYGFFQEQTELNVENLTSSFPSENVKCPCGSTFKLSTLFSLNHHCLSRQHQDVFFPRRPQDVLSISGDQPTNLSTFLSKDQHCFCLIFGSVQKSNFQVHFRSSRHILGLYLQAMAWYMNGIDPFCIEVQCPFLCPYRYSLHVVHDHYTRLQESGQYTAIYCNILRFIPDEMLRDKYNISSMKSIVEHMIPYRILGGPLFKFEDVYDSNGIKIKVDTFLLSLFSKGEYLFHIYPVFGN